MVGKATFALLTACALVRAQSANEFAVFGNDSLTFEGFAQVTGGAAGSNGNINHLAGIARFDSLQAGGSINPNPPAAWNARTNVLGDILAKGPVDINALSNIGGSVQVDGAFHLGSNSPSTNGVGGSIYANGPVTIDSFNTIGGSMTAIGPATLASGIHVNGDLAADGDVSLGIDSHVAGTVYHTGALTTAAFASYGAQATVVTDPRAVNVPHVALPPATQFTSGGADVTVDTLKSVTLAPGSYGALTFKGANTLNLSSGNYYFDSIDSPGVFLDLKLDLSAGPINVFVTGDASFSRITPYINGLKIDQAGSALAADVYLESHGNINMTGQFYGSMYAPDGDITTGTIGSVTGSMIAGHDLVVGSATSITDAATTFIPSRYLAASIPEPGAVPIAAAGLALLTRRRRTAHKTGHA